MLPLVGPLDNQQEGIVQDEISPIHKVSPFLSQNNRKMKLIMMFLQKHDDFMINRWARDGDIEISQIVFIGSCTYTWN